MIGEREEKYRFLFVNNPQPMWIYDLETLAILEVNHTATIHYGYTRDEFLTMTLKDIRPVEDVPALMQNLKTSGNDYNKSGEWRHIKKNGEIIFVEISSHQLIFNERKARHVLVNDITVRKRTEEALRISEDRFRLAMDATNDGLWDWDVLRGLVYYSPGYFRILGYEPNEFDQNIDTWQKLIHPDDIEHAIANNLACINNLTESVHVEYRMKAKDDTWRWVLGRGKAVQRNSDGKALRMIGTHSDVTERKAADNLLHEKNEEIKIHIEEYRQINEALNKTNKDLNKAKEQAVESDRLKTAFLQNMSHEIRTPMNAIIGFSGLLVENYKNKSNLEKFSAIITQRSSDLLDIINDILDIAKIESGQLPINIEECNLHELFTELNSFFAEYQKRIGKQHIEFGLQALYSPLENVISSDRVKLKQIFINLITNAFKFTDTGKIEGGCKFDKNHKLIFYVSDSGIGISPVNQKMVFDRFAQVHQGKNHITGGTGLGLPIVKGPSMEMRLFKYQ